LFFKKLLAPVITEQVGSKLRNVLVSKIINFEEMHIEQL